MRMVSFDPKLRVRLDSFCKDETPVAISDCTVKAADAGAGFELIASPRRSNVTKSAKTFDLSTDLKAIDLDTAKMVHVDDLQDLAVNQLVTVTVKVLSVKPPEDMQSKASWR